jgi:hypothetical protein
MEELKCMLKKEYSKEFHWSGIVRDIVSMSPFSQTIDALLCIDRISWGFPYLVEIADQLETYARTFPDFEERDMYSLYQKIVDCAGWICRDTSVSDEKAREYDKIGDQYQDKLINIVSQDYLLNFDSEE